jgi:hypothetical protein
MGGKKAKTSATNQKTLSKNTFRAKLHRKFIQKL